MKIKFVPVAQLGAAAGLMFLINIALSKSILTSWLLTPTALLFGLCGRDCRRQRRRN